MSPPRRAAKPKQPYHHGELRGALLQSAHEIVEQSGMESLTMRACARRAEVSHAAPAHHFGNVSGLLAELAADYYERLGQTMDQAAEMADTSPLRAAGLGYIRFALSHPQKFRLMVEISAGRTDSKRLASAIKASQNRLLDALADRYYELHGSTLSHHGLINRANLARCVCHGYACLSIEGNAQRYDLPTPEAVLGALSPAMIGVERTV